MTRKRFEKVCMSYRIQRNQAQEMAWEARERYGNYQKGLEALALTLAMKRVSNALKDLANVATKAAREGFLPMVEALRGIGISIDNPGK